MAVAPWPLVESVVEPNSSADRKTLALALGKLAAEDPAFQVAIDESSGQSILKGMDEANLREKIDRLRRICGADLMFGQPCVAYRETVTTRSEIDYTHKNSLRGAGQFARIRIVIGPNGHGNGVTFVSKIANDAVPETYFPQIQKGLATVLGAGILAGFPLMDIRIELVDGAYHDRDSAAPAFEIAARTALRAALQKGRPVLLEPMMKVEVVTPDAYVRPVIEDLHAHRGQIRSQDARGDTVIVSVGIPLAQMLGYDLRLGVMTNDGATFRMMFEDYVRADPPDDDRPPPFAAMRLNA